MVDISFGNKTPVLSLYTSVAGQVFMVRIPGIFAKALSSHPVTLTDKHPTFVVFA